MRRGAVEEAVGVHRDVEVVLKMGGKKGGRVEEDVGGRS